MNAKNIFKIGNLQITTPVQWLDITDEIGEANPPFTLAKQDGAGVIQFSIAEYRSGKLPNVTLEALHELMADFAQSRELGQGYTFAQSRQPLVTASSFDFANTFLRVWYCSDGQNIALVTYNCESGQQQAELPDCESIVLNLRFEA